VDIILIFLFIVFLIIAAVLFADASNTSSGILGEIIPIGTMIAAAIAFLSMYLCIEYFGKYDVSVYAREKGWHEEISKVTENGVRTTTEHKKFQCIVTYDFDKPMVFFDKTDIDITYDSACSEVDSDKLEAKRLKYLGELNEN